MLKALPEPALLGALETFDPETALVLSNDLRLDVDANDCTGSADV